MKIKKLPDHTWFISDNLYKIVREQHHKINELIDVVNKLESKPPEAPDINGLRRNMARENG